MCLLAEMLENIYTFEDLNAWRVREYLLGSTHSHDCSCGDCISCHRWLNNLNRRWKQVSPSKKKINLHCTGHEPVMLAKIFLSTCKAWVICFDRAANITSCLYFQFFFFLRSIIMLMSSYFPSSRDTTQFFRWVKKKKKKKRQEHTGLSLWKNVCSTLGKQLTGLTRDLFGVHVLCLILRGRGGVWFPPEKDYGPS